MPRRIRMIKMGNMSCLTVTKHEPVNLAPWSPAGPNYKIIMQVVRLFHAAT